MILPLALVSLGLAGMSAAAPAPQESGTPDGGSCAGAADGPRNIIFTGPAYLGSATFDPAGADQKLTITQKNELTDLGFTSWIALNDKIIYKNDEGNTTIHVLQTADNGTVTSLQTLENTSAGLVHFEFNADKTLLFGAGFTNGTVDIFTVAEDGQLTKSQTLNSVGEVGPNAARQEGPHVHQIVRDPTGNFFAFNDLGFDAVSVIGSKGNGSFAIISTANTTQPGCGPRHGAFFPAGAAAATHYLLACEMGNMVEVFTVHYDGDDAATAGTMELKPTGRTYSTYPAGVAFNETSAAAGELFISPDNRHVYVTNRLSGIEGEVSDSVAHFDVAGVEYEKQPDGSTLGTVGELTLALNELVSSGGVAPRMFSISPDGKFVYLGNPAVNTDGSETKGMVVFQRDAETGKLEEVASLPLSEFDPNTLDAGPNFMQEV